MRPRIWLAIGLCVGMLGCGGPAPEEEPIASVQVAMTASSNFANHSVRICGDRNLDTDPIYPCEDHPPCDCMDFDANGVPEVVRFTGLCPSSNHPTADWTFTYTVHQGPGCTGPVLAAPPGPTAPDFNLVCYDVRDLAAREHVNRSIEPLAPGDNENQIFCLTREAEKAWAFDVCLDQTTTEERTLGLLRFDCACEPVDTRLDCPPEEPPSACSCPHFDPAVLPPDCTVRPEEGCDIVCAPTAEALAGARYRAFQPNVGSLDLDGEELWLGKGDLTDPANRVGRSFDWGPLHAVHHVEFRYDPAGPSLTSRVDGGNPLPYVLPSPFVGLNSVSLTVRSYHPLSTIDVSEVTIEGIGYPSVSVLRESKSFAYWVEGLDDGFVIQARLELLGGFILGDEDTSFVEFLVGHDLPYLQ